MSDLPTQPNMNIQQMLFDACPGVDISDARGVVELVTQYFKEYIDAINAVDQPEMLKWEPTYYNQHEYASVSKDYQMRLEEAKRIALGRLPSNYRDNLGNIVGTLKSSYTQFPQLIKLNPSVITFPTYSGKKRVYGLLVPVIFREIFPAFQIDVAHMYIYSTKGDKNINIQIKFGDYPTIMGTYYLGQLIKGAYAINVDANIGNVSPVFDPSSEF